MASIPFVGEIASLAAALIWAISLTLFARYGRNLSAINLNFLKNICGAVCFTALILVIRPQWPDQAETYFAFAVSGFLGLALGDTALLAALKKLGAQKTSVSQCGVPLITTGLALVFLGEQLNFWELIGMVFTVTAIGFVLFSSGAGQLESHDSKDLIIGFGYALIAAVCQALAVVIIRKYLQTTDLVLGTTIRLIPALIVLGISSWRQQQFSDLVNLFSQHKSTAATLILAATMGTFLGLLLMSTGAKYTKAGISAALTSTYPIWIIPLAAFWGTETVTVRKSVWTVVAVLGVGIMMISDP